MRFAWSTRADGDLSGDLTERIAALADLGGAPAPWTWLRQVHGSDVVTVTRPGEHAGAEADAAVTTVAGCSLAVRSADCAPVVLEGARSVAVLHLGWRGLLDGLVARTVEVLRATGDDVRSAHLGPCIRPGCYEFADPELARLTARFGEQVAATTTAGRPALDLPGAVAVALREAGVEHLDDAAGCTACNPRWYSHRAHGDTARIATVAWIEAS